MDRLIKKIIEKNNPTVAGLDPVLDYIPEYIKEKAVKAYGRTFEAAAEAILEFNKGLIDALCDVVPAVKPQSAYYEMYGWQGVKALKETIEYAKSKGLYVITDVKRNDIGSTAQSYSKAYLGEANLFGENARAFDADAATVNGYLGSDGIKPFLEDCKAFDKDIFVLVKTSNPSSGELQDKLFENGNTVYSEMAGLLEILSDKTGEYGYTSCGAVVGATYPQQLTELRVKFPRTFFLVPGYGAQGAGAADIAGAFDKNGIGAIINSSRAIMCAYKKRNLSEKEFAEAARDEAIRMREDITATIK